MRKLATAALAFSAAVFAANYILPAVWLPVFAIALAIGGAVLAAFHRKWLRGFVIAAIAADFFTIAYSGTVGLCAAISAYKESKLTKNELVAYAVCSYIYCVDVFASVVYRSKIKKATQV